MQSDFGSACTNARGSILVPAVPMAAIRTAALRQVPLTRRATRFTKRRSVAAAAVASFSIVAIAAAAEIFGTTHVWTDSAGNVSLSTDRLVVTQSPTPADVSAAAEAADFPVTIPLGFPRGTRLATLFTLGSSAIALQYEFPAPPSFRSTHGLYIVLSNPSRDTAKSEQVTGPTSYRMNFHTTPGGATRWEIGGEQVTIPANFLKSSQLDEIRRATIAAAASRR